MISWTAVLLTWGNLISGLNSLKLDCFKGFTADPVRVECFIPRDRKYVQMHRSNYLNVLKKRCSASFASSTCTAPVMWQTGVDKVQHKYSNEPVSSLSVHQLIVGWNPLSCRLTTGNKVASWASRIAGSELHRCFSSTDSTHRGESI